jgi:hypothetical protein
VSDKVGHKICHVHDEGIPSSRSGRDYLSREGRFTEEVLERRVGEEGSEKLDGRPDKNDPKFR